MPSISIKRWLIAGLLTAAFLGFIDATYLTVEHYLGGVVPCVLTAGCDRVTTSVYSHLGPVPVALLGSIYYLAILLAILILVLKKDSQPNWWRNLSYFFTLGLLASFWLVYLQAFILHAWCFYCLISAGTSTLLFIFGFWLRKQLRSN